ncbi:MAG TPA: hypothetical protein VH092_21700 [Urbifossiella sp.]|jgi:hypothetical protein|nr:hypothetical protein [Urbifossiella sp.]
MSTTVSFSLDILDRMVRAVEKVRERLLRAARTLEGAGIPYAVVGGNAVAAWVGKIDEGAVRNTRDVDILIRRADFDATRLAMEGAGFIFGNTFGVDFFVDGPAAKPSEGVHLLYSGEPVKPTDPVPTPDLSESSPGEAFQVVSLEALVRMKLVSYRDKDKTHIRDMIGVGLIDAGWPEKYPPPLDDRLRQILANPDG